jgi:hypothetical protein
MDMRNDFPRVAACNRRRIAHTAIAMIPKQIEQFTATDERGAVHDVRVMELYHMVKGGTGPGDSMRWAKNGRLRFIVDDELEIELDDPNETIRLPGLGRLTRV